MIGDFPHQGALIMTTFPGAEKPANGTHRLQVSLTPCEHATVLAALRYWQRIGPSMYMARDEYDIATDGGTKEPLQPDAIDRLCERINLTNISYDL
jgi:hypothetical protein